jgi:thioredoxin 1
MALLGVACGGGKPAPTPAADTTAACCPPDSAALCCDSTAAGAVCAPLAPPDSAGQSRAAGQAGTARPEPTAEARPASAAALPRLWEFGRGTCVPCKTMKGILDPMAAEFAGKIEIRMINIDDEPGLTKEYRIMTIPTQVFISAAGDELFRHIGVYPRDSILAKFTELGFGACAGGK